MGEHALESTRRDPVRIPLPRTLYGVLRRRFATTPTSSLPAAPLVAGKRLLNTDSGVDVPVQYFQTVVAIELAVAGALLWQMRFFETLPPLARDAATNERDPDYAVTVVGLVLYIAAVAGVLVLLDIE
jgi:hypothetical protein